MEIVESVEEVRRHVRKARASEKRIGLVPTMGALHEGHLSLMRAGRDETEYLAVSVFVNPTQFNEAADLAKYPRQLEADAELAEEIGANLIFAPPAEVMYPEGFNTFIDQDRLTKPWEGEHRPGHFRGVLTVVTKLLNIVLPDAAYFGQKDFQQAAVIRAMVADLNMPVTIRVLPTVREPDGLAMSSRNERLSKTDWQQALCLCEALRHARSRAEAGEASAETLVEEMTEIIRQRDRTRVDYVAIVDPNTLDAKQEVAPGDVALLAVRVGETRLIDNMILLEGRS